MFRPETAYLFDLNNGSPVYLNYVAHQENTPWVAAELVNFLVETCLKFQLRPRSVNLSGARNCQRAFDHFAATTRPSGSGLFNIQICLPNIHQRSQCDLKLGVFSPQICSLVMTLDSPLHQILVCTSKGRPRSPT